MAGYHRRDHTFQIHLLPNFIPAPQPFHHRPNFPSFSTPEPPHTDPLYIHFLPPLKLPPSPSSFPPDSSCSLPPRVHGQKKSGAVRDGARSLGSIDGNGAAPAGVRGRHGRHAPLLPLDLPGGAPSPGERGGAEAEPAVGDGGAGGVQGGAAEEGADHRQARRPRAPGGQGAGQRAGPGPAPPPRRRRRRQAGGAGAPAAAARAGHVERHRLGLQPRLVARRPLLRPRHLLRPAALQRQARRQQPATAGEAAAVRGRRRARHARGEEAAAADGPAAAVRHGGRAAAAEPARRRAAPAVAQPAAGARARRAPCRRRPQRRSLRRRDAPPRRQRRHGAGLRPQRQRLHEAADAHHGHGRRQLLAGLRRQAA